MKPRLERFLPLMLCVFVLASCGKPPETASHSADYQAGYQAGRRDEKIELCALFEKHRAGITNALGAARLHLVQAFCAAL